MLKLPIPAIGVMFGVRLLKMTEQDRWLAEQREAQEAELNDIPMAKKRYIICKQCDEFIDYIMVCKVCYCFMPGKTRLKESECPLGKWKSINET